MADLMKYIGYAAVILSALFLGRWYSIERDKLLMQGEPWIKSWTTVPGMMILIIVAVLIALKLKFG
ncbi:hypothetical protein JCM14469_31890 [Desulfatiferula olefinivorans]